MPSSIATMLIVFVAPVQSVIRDRVGACVRTSRSRSQTGGALRFV